MICRGMYGLSLLAFLLLSFSQSLFSDVTLTDQEYNEIQRVLIVSEKELESLEKANNELKNILTMLKSEQKLSSDIISLLKMESSLLKESLKERKSALIIHDIKIYGLGLLTGFVIGIPAGVKIGITL